MPSPSGDLYLQYLYKTNTLDKVCEYFYIYVFSFLTCSQIVLVLQINRVHPIGFEALHALNYNKSVRVK